MFQVPDSPKKIRARIRSYEKKLFEEKQQFGAITDGYGKRFLLGPLYMLLEDVDGALESYRWLESEVPDDSGEPAQYLCWTLALYRSGDLEAAKHKLRQTMLQNLYIIPRLLGIEPTKHDIWHGSNLAEPEHFEYLPEEYFGLWDEDALKWASDHYHSEEFKAVEARHIEIHRQLLGLRPGPERTRLVNEAFKLSQ